MQAPDITVESAHHGTKKKRENRRKITNKK